MRPSVVAFPTSSRCGGGKLYCRGCVRSRQWPANDRCLPPPFSAFHHPTGTPRVLPVDRAWYPSVPVHPLLITLFCRFAILFQGYDGGDCCPCTCVVRYRCIDPTAPCVDDDLITAEMVENCGFLHGYGVQIKKKTWKLLGRKTLFQEFFEFFEPIVRN